LFPLLVALASVPASEPKETPPSIPTYGRTYSIAGLPQHDYRLDAQYQHGTLVELRCAGTVGFVIRPRGEVDAQRRWVWVSNLFLAAIHNKRPDVAHRFYVEQLLARGFHVVGIDVGTSCGSPAGAAVYDEFYRLLIEEYRLHAKARMIGQSNGGLITFGFAFRYPDRVDRILGICPATDLRSWPGLHRLSGGVRITPAGLSYDVERDDWPARLGELNPIDNLAPLAAAGVQLFHIHGTQDEIVPLEPNSGELARRYRALGGRVQIEVIENGTHGAPRKAFFESQHALAFLLE
jgi:pimeloyl-ACP methyl ester carboxylesterase